MYKVIITTKGTHKSSVLDVFPTEEAAERECESWGWSYDDGKISYWMSIEEE